MNAGVIRHNVWMTLKVHEICFGNINMGVRHIVRISRMYTKFALAKPMRVLDTFLKLLIK